MLHIALCAFAAVLLIIFFGYEKRKSEEIEKKLERLGVSLRHTFMSDIPEKWKKNQQST